MNQAGQNNRPHQEERNEKSSPSYEAERKEKEDKFSYSGDSEIRVSGTSAEIEEEDEETTLNQSEIQEGPKGSPPAEDRRTA